MMGGMADGLGKLHEERRIYRMRYAYSGSTTLKILGTYVEPLVGDLLVQSFLPSHYQQSSATEDQI